MKKFLLILLLVFAFMITTACNSEPPVVPEEPPQKIEVVEEFEPEDEFEEIELVEEEPEDIYIRFSNGVILDRARNYTVVKGDTLSEIAKEMYEDGALYPLIMMVSDEVDVSNPDKIMPGYEFLIPDAMLNMNDPTARLSINGFFLDIARFEDEVGRPKTAELIRAHTREAFTGEWYKSESDTEESYAEEAYESYSFEEAYDDESYYDEFYEDESYSDESDWDEFYGDESYPDESDWDE